MAGSGPGSEVKVKTWLQALLGVLVRHFVERLQFGYSVFFSRSDGFGRNSTEERCPPHLTRVCFEDSTNGIS